MLADASPEREHQATQKPRGRMTAAERRAAIVEAAIERFARHGFRGTTTRELAAAAGVSEPVLYQHFATKRDLYTAIVDHLIEKTHERFAEKKRQLAAGCTDREFFQSLGESILSFYLDTPDQVRLLIFSALEGHELAELWYRKATLEFIRGVEQYIERRMAEGAFRPGEAEVAARAFIHMVAQYGFSAMLFPQHRLKLENSEIISRFVDIFFDGVLAKDSKSGEIHADK